MWFIYLRIKCFSTCIFLWTTPGVTRTYFNAKSYETLSHEERNGAIQKIMTTTYTGSASMSPHPPKQSSGSVISIFLHSSIRVFMFSSFSTRAASSSSPTRKKCQSFAFQISAKHCCFTFKHYAHLYCSKLGPADNEEKDAYSLQAKLVLTKLFSVDANDRKIFYKK